MKKLIISALLLGLSGQAMATDWWVYNGATGHCEPATDYAASVNMPQFSNPYGYREYERGFPQAYKGMTVQHVQNALLVVFHIDHGRVIYASTHAACSKLGGIVRSVKLVPNNLNELK
jgi:hypothetical protein